MYKWLIILALIFFSTLSEAQLVYTKHFTEKLNQVDLYFYEPTEDWLHLTPTLQDEIFNYDLMLLSEEEDLEIRFIITPFEERKDLLQFPHIEFTRILTNLATNNSDEDIVVSQIDGPTIKHVFQADWALMADFVPKKGVSHLDFGRIYSFFKEELGIATIIIFSASKEIEEMYQRLLSFKPELE